MTVKLCPKMQRDVDRLFLKNYNSNCPLRYSHGRRSCGGIKANSLAIVTDAAHLLSDVAAFPISFFSLCAAGWKATPRQSYGFFRLEIIGAWYSIQLIWLLSGILVYKAIDRLFHETGEVQGCEYCLILLWLCYGTCLPKKKQWNINIQGAYLHVLSDFKQNIGVMIGGAIILVQARMEDHRCYVRSDILCDRSGYYGEDAAYEVLMESTPREIDAARLGKGLCEMEGVVEIHELYIWAITVGKVLLACHFTITTEANSDLILEKMDGYLQREYNMNHVTIQIERQHQSVL